MLDEFSYEQPGPDHPIFLIRKLEIKINVLDGYKNSFITWQLRNRINQKIKALKIIRLKLMLELRKNRLNNHPDPANMLDGKHGKISFYFKWLDGVEEKIKWRKYHFDEYKIFNDMYKAFNDIWSRKGQEDGI